MRLERLSRQESRNRLRSVREAIASGMIASSGFSPLGLR